MLFFLQVVLFRRFAKLRKATISFVMSVRLSVRMEQLGSQWTDFDKIWCLGFFPKISPENSTSIKIWQKITGTLHEHDFAFMTICRWVLLRTRNVSNKNCRENQSTYFMFINFFSEHRVFYEIMSKNLVESERPPTIWRLRVACCISKATCAKVHSRVRARIHTHGRTHTDKYVILIAFPQLERFCERASVLRYTYIACIV